MLACGFETEAKNKDKVTPLHRAAMGGHVDAVRVLLKYGADVNAKDGMFAAPPLVWAVRSSDDAGERGTGCCSARPFFKASPPVA
jgi:ankyrin repeat protein